MSTSQDYNATISLPKTDFPMRAGLPKREPAMLAAWQESKLYDRLMETNKDKPLFVLHDGPPFSNNDIHVGTAMNKILKDFIVRYKNMSGFRAPYVPGWDNHGMPIESAILKKNKTNRKEMSIPAFRDACQEFAAHYVDVQKEQFVRLGILGEWDDPYLTMDPSFEAQEVNIFGEMAAKGYIYRGLKPVYWCPHDETALAEAEIEYQDEDCTSIYVKFPVVDDKGLLQNICPLDKTYFVIWTTTTWTLPGNVAISVHPRFDYGVYKIPGGDYLVIAEALAQSVAEAAGHDPATDWEKIASFTGAQLEHITTQHPFLPRESLVIVGEHVTDDSGTGCVHTAPGHGMEDYFACKPYDLPIPVPVSDTGVMTEEAGSFAGLYYAKANGAILETLRESGLLLASQTIQHTYPHCWRCKKPVIYRATKQWFASVDAMKDDALAAVDTVRWVPEWGKERMTAMVRDRADWCISRQRHWGLPIPVFYCAACAEPMITPESIAAVSALFAKEGSNAWYVKPAEEILPAGTACPHCGHTAFTQETDTLDGWFDSGSTHRAVLSDRWHLPWPADVYLEGGDQFRGWFQSSLLTAVATNGKAPYRTVIVHGWTVDGEGKKMSKSVGNVVNPQDVVAQFGADILRLWVASSDYHNDVKISPDLLKNLSEIYLKIRNTARFLLGNLHDFDPAAPQPYEALSSLDKFVLHRLHTLIAKVTASYEAYEYHTIFHALHNFCVTDLSTFYLDIVKDSLYCDGADTPARRGIQTVMYEVLSTLTRLMAPILAFTSEEIWASIRHSNAPEGDSVLFHEMPRVNPAYALSAEDEALWDALLAWRGEINMALEHARADKKIGKPLEAHVILTAKDDDLAFLRAQESLLTSLCIVSQVSVREGERAVTVESAQGVKCARCWIYTQTPDETLPNLCPRCADVVHSL